MWNLDDLTIVSHLRLTVPHAHILGCGCVYFHRVKSNHRALLCDPVRRLSIMLAIPVGENSPGMRVSMWDVRKTDHDDLQDAKSNYLAVQDFSHIRATPSPNWLPLPEGGRVADDRWPVSRADPKEVLETLLPAQ